MCVWSKILIVFLHILKLFLLFSHLFLQIFSLDLQVAAHTASYSERLHGAVGRVLEAERAIIFALALVPWRPLSVVAVHAVVIHATAVVGSHVATEVAFVLDVGFLMLLAIGDAVLVVRILVEKLALRALQIVHIEWAQVQTAARRSPTSK